MIYANPTPNRIFCMTASGINDFAAHMKTVLPANVYEEWQSGGTKAKPAATIDAAAERALKERKLTAPPEAPTQLARNFCRELAADLEKDAKALAAKGEARGASLYRNEARKALAYASGEVHDVDTVFEAAARIKGDFEPETNTPVKAFRFAGKVQHGHADVPSWIPQSARHPRFQIPASRHRQAASTPTTQAASTTASPLAMLTAADHRRIDAAAEAYTAKLAGQAKATTQTPAPAPTKAAPAPATSTATATAGPMDLAAATATAQGEWDRKQTAWNASSKERYVSVRARELTGAFVMSKPQQPTAFANPKPDTKPTALEFTQTTSNLRTYHKPATAAR